jgi:hypothetical protein
MRVEGCAQVKLNAGHLEEVAPHVTGKDQVVVADNGGGEVVKTYNALEEFVSD